MRQADKVVDTIESKVDCKEITLTLQVPITMAKHELDDMILSIIHKVSSHKYNQVQYQVKGHWAVVQEFGHFKMILFDINNQVQSTITINQIEYNLQIKDVTQVTEDTISIIVQGMKIEKQVR